MKKRITAAVLTLIMMLTLIPLAGVFITSAVNKVTVSAQFIVDNNNKYMERFDITFDCIARDADSATLKITWKNTIFAGKYDEWRYDAKVDCGSVSTGRKIVVPKGTWKKGAADINTPRSKEASTTLKIPLSTVNETKVSLKCYEYQCDGSGNIRYTEKDKPGTVSYTIPKYTAPATTYTLSYNANGGSGAPAAQSGAVQYTIPSTKPTRSGYTFLGWSKSGTATAAEYSAGSTITLSASTTLYAVWKKVEASNIYNLGDETYSFSNIVRCNSGKSCHGWGHCYGMSVTSEAYYHGVISKASVGASESQSVYSLSASTAVKSYICYYQRKQSNQTIVAGGRAYRGKPKNVSADWEEVVNYVKNHQYDNKGTLIVSIRNNDGGHAVDFLYYKEVDGQQRLYIYDNNHPEKETYIMKDFSGNIVAPNSLKNIHSIALRSFQKCIDWAEDHDGTHTIYAQEGAIEVEGAEASPMDLGEEGNYVAYEVPENFCEVIITPLEDNAEFSYMDEEYSFGNIQDDTYGVFTLNSSLDTDGGAEKSFAIENAAIISDVSLNYKGTTALNLIVDEAVEVEYTSSNPDVVQVDENGIVTGLKAGVSMITCTMTDAQGNRTVGTCTVKVSYAWWQWIIRVLFLGFLWY